MQMRRVVTLGLVAVVSLGVTACSPSTPVPPPLPPELEAIRPSQFPPAQASPTAAPNGFQAVSGEGFELSIPPGWAEAPRGNNPLQAIYQSPDDKQTLLGITVEKNPPSGIIAQSMVAEAGNRSKGATNAVRSEVTWPGAERAIIMDWRVKVGGPQGPEFRYRQLMLEVNSSLIVSVVGMAPVNDFEASGIAAAIQTFRAQP